MDGRGGCCMARYAGSMHDISKVDRIMLRFRPIAPKPAANRSVSTNSTPENSSGKSGRRKRRYVKNSGKSGNNDNSSTKRCKCKSGSSRRRKSSSPEEDDRSNCKSTVSTGSVPDGDNIVTLPLLPEGKATSYPPARGTFSGGGVEKAPLWLNFGSNELQRVGGGIWAEGAAVRPRKVVDTWVKVESITETLVDGYGRGCTDEGKLRNILESDTCPGFISDGLNRVRWVNRAYREMVKAELAEQEEEEEEEEEIEVLVGLVMKEGLELPVKIWPAFTCGVRVVTCEKGKSSVILPCDVWRLECGQGFAWRLDVKAALSLGR